MYIMTWAYIHLFIITWYLEWSSTAVVIRLFTWLRFAPIFHNFLYYSTFVLCCVLQCDHRKPCSFVSYAICTISTLKFGRRGLCEVTRQYLNRIQLLKNFQIHFWLVKAHKSRAKTVHDSNPWSLDQKSDALSTELWVLVQIDDYSDHYTWHALHLLSVGWVSKWK